MLLLVIGLWLLLAPPDGSPVRHAASPTALHMPWTGTTMGSWRAASSLTAAASAASGVSAPLSLTGEMGVNVRLALDANGGALRSVVIPPGTTWSFNAAIGDPRHLPVRTVAGVPGGGWCDLASRYVQAVRPLLPPDAVQFVNHVQSTGVGLANVAPADAVAIWNIDGQPGSFGGRLDLLITNSLPSPLVLSVAPGPQPDAIVVEARVEPLARP